MARTLPMSDLEAAQLFNPFVMTSWCKAKARSYISGARTIARTNTHRRACWRNTAPLARRMGEREAIPCHPFLPPSPVALLPRPSLTETKYYRRISSIWCFSL
ncbi:hypothetical protein E2C01_074874 [Portunus trituberculatus]|uniref:Uncharacterized protein n=1 Tax=Portunus trituberculatus TaxID=210409 RepID=A0A5B7IEA6_PORTR|nr:hypothetical protein [Portunus trituberculatus]